MERKIVAVLALSLLSVSALSSIGAIHYERLSDSESWRSRETQINPDHLIAATNVGPETFDSAWATDEASLELIFNIHDRLVAFNVTRPIVDPLTAGKTSEFVSGLATEWHYDDIVETSPEGLLWVRRWYFRIRTNITFHNGSPLSPQDVEYTFERWMVQCRQGGFTWMILEPLLGVQEVRPNYPNPDPAVNSKMIDHAIESNSSHVWFNLVENETQFLYVLAQAWSSILDYEWCTSIDDWPGIGVPFEDRWGDYTEWVDWNNPDVSPIDLAYQSGIKPVGIGPYKFDDYAEEAEWRVSKFGDYYGGWPAPGCADYVSNVTMKIIPDWSTRKMMLLAGEIDICCAEEEIYVPGILCYKLAKLPLMVLFFNYNISTKSPLLGVPGGLPPGTIDETGIPPDFFSDIDVRKAIAHCFNSSEYIGQTGIQAIHCNTTIIPGILYHNPDQWGYHINLTEAKERFQQAWGGRVWADGFTFGIAYNTGNSMRKITAQMLKAAIEGPVIGNPKFHVDLYEFDWPTYLGMLINDELTLLVMGYNIYPHDPHNYIYPFMHPDVVSQLEIQYGQSGRRQYDLVGNPNLIIDNEYVSMLIETAADTSNGLWDISRIVQNITIIDMINPKGSRWQDSLGNNYTVIGYVDSGWPASLSESDILWLEDAQWPYERYRWHIQDLQAIATPDRSIINLQLRRYVRGTIYYELQEIYVDECPSFPISCNARIICMRDWVWGWYHNPAYPGLQLYFYHYCKALTQTPVDVEVSAIDIAIGSNNMTEWLINQWYHAPRPGVPWMKFNQITGGTEPVAHVNAIIQRFDEHDLVIYIYAMWIGVTANGRIHEFHSAISPLGPAGSGSDVITVGPGKVSDEYLAPGNYTLKVHIFVFPSYVSNIHLSPNFDDSWFIVLGFCDVNSDWIVDVTDYMLVKGAIPSMPGNPKWRWTADLDCNYVVDVTDYVLVKSKIPTQYVPA